MMFKSQFGRTGYASSRIIFGGWALNRATQADGFTGQNSSAVKKGLYVRNLLIPPLDSIFIWGSKSQVVDKAGSNLCGLPLELIRVSVPGHISRTTCKP
jgi:hypothetical protein